jgi:hypothetical protein
LDSTTCGEFLGKLKYLSASQGLWSMEFVNVSFLYAIPSTIPYKKKGALLLHNLLFCKEKKKAAIH